MRIWTLFAVLEGCVFSTIARGLQIPMFSKQMAVSELVILGFIYGKWRETATFDIHLSHNKGHIQRRLAELHSKVPVYLILLQGELKEISWEMGTSLESSEVQWG